jgi:hypothetical protein
MRILVGYFQHAMGMMIQDGVINVDVPCNLLLLSDPGDKAPQLYSRTESNVAMQVECSGL